MNKTEYLLQLQKYLKKLPKADYDNAMDYFTEYFDEAGSDREQEVIRELGTPKEAAGELLRNLLSQKIDSPGRVEKKLVSAHSLLLVTFLSILTVPAGLPVLCAIVILFVCFLLLVILLFGAAFCDIAVFAASMYLLVQGLQAVGDSLSGACMLLGISLAGMGLCILLSFFVLWVCQKMVVGAARFIQFLGQ